MESGKILLFSPTRYPPPFPSLSAESLAGCLRARAVDVLKQIRIWYTSILCILSSDSFVPQEMPIIHADFPRPEQLPHESQRQSFLSAHPAVASLLT